MEKNKNEIASENINQEQSTSITVSQVNITTIAGKTKIVMNKNGIFISINETPSEGDDKQKIKNIVSTYGKLPPNFNQE